MMTEIDKWVKQEGIELSIKAKLAKHIIDKSKPEWCAKMKNVLGQEWEIPRTLDGEVLLRIDKDEKGRVKGVITITIERLAKLVNHWKAGNPIPAEWREKLDEWLAEGIDILA